MTKKLIRVGNSYAVIIPKSFLKEVERDVNTIYVSLKPEGKKIIIDFSLKEMVDDIVDPEVYTVAKQLLKRYLPAFKELAKK